MDGYYYIRLLMISDLISQAQDVEASELIDVEAKLYALQKDLERVEIFVQDLLVSIHRDLRTESRFR
jgi:hypothetical protein